jgi:transposase
MVRAGCAWRQLPTVRTFAWLTAHRRLARDYQRDPAISNAVIRWAAISTITRRIARGGPATPPATADTTTTTG